MLNINKAHTNIVKFAPSEYLSIQRSKIYNALLRISKNSRVNIVHLSQFSTCIKSFGFAVTTMSILFMYITTINYL